MATQVAPSPAGWHSGRRFLGLRNAPGRLAVAVLRIPLALYRRGWGWMLGRTFCCSCTSAARPDGGTRPWPWCSLTTSHPRLVICSAWGPGADWLRNLHAAPRAEILIGRDRFSPPTGC